MDAYDLIISVMALNPNYNYEIEPSKILDNYPNEVLQDVGIRPHPIHGDSQTLDNALNDLLKNRVLKLWSPGQSYSWDFPHTPLEYFKDKIKPKLSKEKISKLEEFANSL